MSDLDKEELLATRIINGTVWFEDMINTITLGDCYKLIKNIPDKCIDLILTDPPYNFHCGTINKSGIFKDRLTIPGEEIVQKKINNGFDLHILQEFVRVLKNINIFLWCNKEQIKDYLNFFDNYNTSFEIITWHKTNPTPLTKNTFLPDTEYCLYFREKGKVFLNDGYELKSKYYISETNINDKEKFMHPTIKPLEIIKKQILHTTQVNDIVLDCFSGSGTTCVAAKKLNRRFVGIEIDKKYHKISVDRLNGILANGQISFDTDINKI